jgi:hypothetical protein
LKTERRTSKLNLIFFDQRKVKRSLKYGLHSDEICYSIRAAFFQARFSKREDFAHRSDSFAGICWRVAHVVQFTQIDALFAVDN